MIIQQAPSRADDGFGELLAKDGGEKLNWFLEQSGIDYEDVYFTSAIKCKPEKISDISKKHIKACEPYLLEEIIEVKPEIIVCMGKAGFQSLLGHTSVYNFRGHIQDFSMQYDALNSDKVLSLKSKVMATFDLHGSFGKWEYNDDIIRDFKKVQKYVDTKIIDRTKEPEVNLILSLEALDEWVDRYKTVKYAATDFETTGLDFWKHLPFNSGYCSEEGKSDVLFILPYKNEHTDKWDREDKLLAKKINDFVRPNQSRILKALKEVHGGNTKWILHNGKFDSKFAMRIKAPYKHFWFDTMNADSLVDETVGHSLNIACERRGINFGAYDTLLWKYTNKDEKNKKTYQYVPPAMIVKYLGIDADACFRLFHKAYKELKEENQLERFLKVKMQTVRDVTICEYIGFKADRNLIEESGKIIEERMDAAQKELEDFTGIDGFNVNSPKQMNEFMVGNEYPLDKAGLKTNKVGYSTAGEELEKLKRYKKNNCDKFPDLVKEFKSMSKIKGTYVDGKYKAVSDRGDNVEAELGGMLKHLDKHDRIHPSYNLHTPVTGRESCFRSGSRVDVVRDISKQPNGIPIEKVKVGDLVYCYDNENKLTIRPVLKRFDNGPKKLVRLHWRSVSGRKGYIDLTPDHKTGLWDGTYKRVDQLEKGERLLFMSRHLNKKERPVINAKGLSKKEAPEHRFVFEKLNGYLPEVVHHVNHNKLDSRPSNLAAMSETDHKSYHAKYRWDKGEMVSSIKIGEENTNYYNWSKFETLKVLSKCKGKVKKSGYDYYTVIRYCEKHSISIDHIRDRYNANGFLINKSEVEKAANLTFDDCCRVLGVGDVVCRRLFDHFKIEKVKQSKKPPINKGNKIYRKYSKFQLLKEFVRCRGVFNKNSLLPRKSFCRQLKHHSIDYKSLKYRFTGKGYVNRPSLQNSDKTNIATFIKLGVSERRFLKICESHNYTPIENHFVDYIEDINEIDNVYCLEVEEFHNFIVNEIKFSNCSSPSVQVWPRPIDGLINCRNFVIPTSKDWCLFEGDYSAAEVNLAGYLSKDPVLLKLLKDGTDIHCFNAVSIGGFLGMLPSWVKYGHMMVQNGKEKDLDCSKEEIEEFKKEVLEKDPENKLMWKELRTRAKSLGFGLNYGKEAYSFAEEFGISEEEAQLMIDGYFETYKVLKKWRDNVVNQALDNGYVESVLSGRKRRFFGATEWLYSDRGQNCGWSTNKTESGIERQAMNFPVQHGTQTVFEPALIRINRRFRKEGLTARILFRIHDGILGECLIKDRLAVDKCIREEMPYLLGKGTDTQLQLKVDTDYYAWEWYGEKIKLDA